uniref:TRPM SLOG domain-containing protein n=1 Tax=Haplochromis burtoni TaxID=8153 RepID=A0A3Q2VX72_HAPBU
CSTFVEDSVRYCDLYYFSTAIVNHWESVQHSSEQPTDAFGEVQFAGFLRLSWSTEPFFVYNILTTHWGLPPPNLVVSVVGGNSAWILTTGLRERLGRCVGQAVRDHAAAASSVSLNKVVALGIAPWGVNRHIFCATEVPRLSFKICLL